MPADVPSIPAVELRPATAADVDFLYELHRDALGPYVDRVWGWEDDAQRAFFSRTLSLDRVQVVVVDGVDVGRLDLEDRDDSVFLALIELAPAHQRRGVGSRLVRGVLDDARAAGKHVTLSTLAVNTDAHRLYRRLGFTETHRHGEAPAVHIEMRSADG